MIEIELLSSYHNNALKNSAWMVNTQRNSGASKPNGLKLTEPKRKWTQQLCTRDGLQTAAHKYMEKRF